MQMLLDSTTVLELKHYIEKKEGGCHAKQRNVNMGTLAVCHLRQTWDSIARQGCLALTRHGITRLMA
jgi:hypothetical protein